MMIITDSASDITLEESKIMNVHVVPLKMTINEKEYSQETTEAMNEFYEDLEVSIEMPKTSCPTPEQYLTLINQAKKNNEEVIILCLSSGLSGTYDSAVLASQLSNYEDNISVVDTKQAIIAQRIMVDYAVKLRDEGKSRSEIVSLVENAAQRTTVYGVIDTLKYLRKGGRIPKSLAVLGDALKIKPLLELKDGELIEIGKKRGINGAKKRMIEYMNQYELDPNFPVLFGYIYNNQNTKDFMNEVVNLKNIKNYNMHQVGGTIGTHLGLNGIGIAFVKS